MFGRSVGILTACALGASAFLIPPGVTIDSDNVAPLEASTLWTSGTKVVTLPCPGCVFPTKQTIEEGATDVSDDLFWAQGSANSLVLKFKVSEDGKALELGGEPIYPIFDQPINVDMVPSSATEYEIELGSKSNPLRVSEWRIKTLDQIKPMAEKEDETFTLLEFSINGLEDQKMTVDSVLITLAETASGQMILFAVEPRPTQPMPIFKGRPAGPHGQHSERPHDEKTHMRPSGRPHGSEHHRGPGHKMHKQCGALPGPLCKLKHMIESKVFGMSKPSCHGRKGKGKGMEEEQGHPWKGQDGRVRLPSHIKGPKFPNSHADEADRPHHDGEEDRPDHGRNHHMRPHHEGGHHHRHHHKHGFLHAMVRGFFAVLVPVVVGVVVGIMVSVVGLVVGRLVTFLWVTLVRGGRRGNYSRVALDENTVLPVDEKVVVEVEAPPEYADEKH